MGTLADSSTSMQSTNSAASQLGPSTSATPDSSDATSGVLQPASSMSLQSNNDSSGDQSASNTLQAPGNSSQSLQVLSDNADGSPQAPSTASVWGWVLLVVGLLAVSGGASYLLYRSNKPLAEIEVAGLDVDLGTVEPVAGDVGDIAGSPQDDDDESNIDPESESETESEADFENDPEVEPAVEPEDAAAADETASQPGE